MQTKSRDGKFIIIAPDEAKTRSNTINLWKREDEKYDEEVNVLLKAIEGKEISICDVADTIRCDCFSSDSLGLRLLAKKINCQVEVGERIYNFTTIDHSSLDQFLEDISSQFKL